MYLTMVIWHLRHLILIDYSNTLYIARLNNENCTLQQNYLVIPYNSYNKAAIIFLDGISTYNTFTCKQIFRTEACSESLYLHRAYISFNFHKPIYAFLPLYSITKCWFGTQIPLCTDVLYRSPKIPSQFNHTFKIYYIASLHTTKRSRWSNNLLLYIPNSPSSLTLPSSPPSNLHWFCSISSRVMRGHCPGTFKE